MPSRRLHDYLLAASLNPVDMAVASELNPFRRPGLPLVLWLDGVARRPAGALVHFFRPAAPYGAFAERVPLADAETVPLPDVLDASRAAALGISGVAVWTALAGTGALRPGESVLVLAANGQVGQAAVQAARLLGAPGDRSGTAPGGRRGPAAARGRHDSDLPGPANAHPAHAGTGPARL